MDSAKVLDVFGKAPSWISCVLKKSAHATTPQRALNHRCFQRCAADVERKNPSRHCLSSLGHGERSLPRNRGHGTGSTFNANRKSLADGFNGGQCGNGKEVAADSDHLEGVRVLKQTKT